MEEKKEVVQEEQNAVKTAIDEPKKKSKAPIIIGIVLGVLALLAIIVIVFIVLVVLVFNKVNNEVVKNPTTVQKTPITNTPSTNTPSSNKPSTTPSNEKIGTLKDSSADEPLKINEWGKVSKYLSSSKEYDTNRYNEVGVRVTKVTRGTEAETIVKNWFDSQKYYKYTEPKNTTEWVVIDYQVDLSKVTYDEGTIGNSIKVDSYIKGLDGKTLRYNDITYFISTKDISDSSYTKEPGVYNGQFIATIPEGCTDYLVVLGQTYSDRTAAYIKAE